MEVVMTEKKEVVEKSSEVVPGKDTFYTEWEDDIDTSHLSDVRYYRESADPTYRYYLQKLQGDKASHPSI